MPLPKVCMSRDLVAPPGGRRRTAWEEGEERERKVARCSCSPPPSPFPPPPLPLLLPLSPSPCPLVLVGTLCPVLHDDLTGIDPCSCRCRWLLILLLLLASLTASSAVCSCFPPHSEVSEQGMGCYQFVVFGEEEVVKHTQSRTTFCNTYFNKHILFTSGAIHKPCI